MKEMIPISRVVPTRQGEELLVQAYQSGRWSQGPLVEKFEQEVALLSGCKYAVAVSNGTIALEAMLRAVGHEGDSVLTSPLTFRATLKAIEHARMRPYFEDVDKDSLILSFEPTEWDTDWIMPVDLYGRNCGYAGENVLADSAQSIGVDMSSRRASSISFYSGKNVGCGEGGVIVSNDEALVEKIKRLRNQGMASQYEYETEEGYNWRMTELQAAVALPQLYTLEEANEKRQNNAKAYNKAFIALPVRLPWVSEEMVFHQYTLRHPKRNEIAAILRYEGIDARIYYPQLVSPKEEWDKTPVAQKAVQEIFSIPVHQHLTEDELKHITEKVIAVVKAVG